MSVYQLTTPSHHLFSVNGHWIGRDLFAGMPFTARGVFSASGSEDHNGNFISDRSHFGLVLTSITNGVPTSYSATSRILTSRNSYKTVIYFQPFSAKDLSLTATCIASGSGTVTAGFYGKHQTAYGYPDASSYDNLASTRWSANYVQSYWGWQITSHNLNYYSNYKGGWVDVTNERGIHNDSTVPRPVIKMETVWNFPQSFTNSLDSYTSMPYFSGQTQYDSAFRLSAGWTATGLYPV